MFFRQILHDDLGCASYFVACGGKAAVVDPQWDIQPYLDIAAAQHFEIAHIVLTHNHADHVSGHGRLAAASGATIHISDQADAAYDHEPVRDGDSISIGKAELRAMATPGHRPEHMSFLLIDHARSRTPWALLAGDFVFVGDLARPDLAVEPRDGAAAIFDSLKRLDEHPATLEIWPGHTGGSLCGGAGMSRKPSTTLGFEQAANPTLRIADQAAFVDELTSGLAPQPPNFQRIAKLNQGPLHRDRPEPAALTPQATQALLDDGAVLIDVRDPSEYDAEHVPGSLNVTAAAAGVGTRAGWLTEPGAVVIIAASSDAAAHAALINVEAAGLLNTHGYLSGGVPAWRQAGLSIESTAAIDVPTLVERLRDTNTVLVDVREDDEWRAGHVPGSIHAPFHRLRDHIPAELRDVHSPARIAVACSAGNRSALAASYLRRAGIDLVDHVTDGGIPDLTNHGLALTEGA